jgi:AcrR family transcriptional regulator
MVHADGMVVNRKAAQGQATRQELVRTATDLFGRQGYSATSLNDVVTAAQVTKGAFYHHFESKEELFLVVFEQVKREIADSVSGGFFGPVGYPAHEPWEDLVAWCSALFEAHLRPAVRRICLVDAPAVLGLDVLRRVEARHGEVLLRAALRRAMNRGVIVRQPLRPLARMVTGALFEGCLLVAEAEDRDSARAEVWPTFLRLLGGLRISPASAPTAVAAVKEAVEDGGRVRP